MDRFFLDRVTLGVRALAVRLRAPALLDRSALPAALSALTPSGASRAVPRDVAEQAIEASERLCARLFLVPNTCLYRSLARYAVLRRAGHPARFVLGLDPEAGEILGHAWVELDGEPVGETIEPGLAVTFAYPSPAPSPRGPS
jgi:hypothetical protein